MPYLVQVAAVDNQAPHILINAQYFMQGDSPAVARASTFNATDSLKRAVRADFLAMRTKSAGHFYTVGGGVHMNEKAEECIVREVREETGVDYEVDHLAVICENFFVGHEPGLADLNCHVIEFYYLMKSRGKKDAHCESYGWNNDKEEICWIPLDELKNTNLKPEFLCTRMNEIVNGKSVIHVINDER